MNYFFVRPGQGVLELCPLLEILINQYKEKVCKSNFYHSFQVNLFMFCPISCD